MLMRPKSKALAAKSLLRRPTARARPHPPSSQQPKVGTFAFPNSSLPASAKTSSSTLRGGHTPAPSTPKIKLEALYLFSGEPRDCDLTMEIVRAGHARGIQFEVTEIDLCQGPDQDLRMPAAWELILSQIASKKYIIVFMSPPCNTFSRALYNTLVAGPLPLRSIEHPKGFPWLSRG